MSKQWRWEDLLTQPEAAIAGMRVRQKHSGRYAFVLYRSNTDTQLVVRFDDFAYNSVVEAELFEVLPPEPFRRSVEDIAGHPGIPNTERGVERLLRTEREAAQEPIRPVCQNTITLTDGTQWRGPGPDGPLDMSDGPTIMEEEHQTSNRLMPITASTVTAVEAEDPHLVRPEVQLRMQTVRGPRSLQGRPLWVRLDESDWDRILANAEAREIITRALGRRS